MTYENPLHEYDNRVALKNALIRWVFGNDGCEGAIGGVTGEIPWNFDDFGLWDKWSEKFDEAIGSRERWDVAKVLADRSHRADFYNFIDGKVDRIMEVYQKVVDELNNTRKYCGVVEKSDYVDGNGIARYTLVERVYGETKYEVVTKIWAKYAFDGEWKFEQFVDAMFDGKSVNLTKPKLYAHLGDYITNADC